MVNKYTMITEDDAQVIRRCVEAATHLEGEVAEVGVSLGDTAEIICQTAPLETEVHLFDTWEGHPRGWVQEGDTWQHEGRHAASLDDLRKRLQSYSTVFYHQGIFPDTTGPVERLKFCYVNIDTDLYLTTRVALRFFMPRMVRGGIITIHDCPGIFGVARAIDEYFGDYHRETHGTQVGKNQFKIIA